MNRNGKEKIVRIDIRVTPNDKAKIQSNAKKCNLSMSQFIIKRALGYEPKAVLPRHFYDFYGTLCDLSNRKIDEKTNIKLKNLIDEINKEFILPRKEDDTMWQQQDSGQSKTD